MARQTHCIDQLGIRVEGYANKTEARKAWEAKRDHWCDISTACPPWIFARNGFTVIVCPTPEYGWEYTLVTPEYTGRRHPSGYFNADSQIAAIAAAIGSLAQAMWTRDVADDSEFFLDLCRAARITIHEARYEYDNFVTVAGHWRNHPSAA